MSMLRELNFFSSLSFPLCQMRKTRGCHEIAVSTGHRAWHVVGSHL